MESEICLLDIMHNQEMQRIKKFCQKLEKEI